MAGCLLGLLLGAFGVGRIIIKLGWPYQAGTVFFPSLNETRRKATYNRGGGDVHFFSYFSQRFFFLF